MVLVDEIDDGNVKATREREVNNMQGAMGRTILCPVANDGEHKEVVVWSRGCCYYSELNEVVMLVAQYGEQCSKACTELE